MVHCATNDARLLALKFGNGSFVVAGAPNPDHSLGWRSFGRPNTPQLIVSAISNNLDAVLEYCETLDWDSDWGFANPLQNSQAAVGNRVRTRSRSEETASGSCVQSGAAGSAPKRSRATSQLSVDLVREVLHLLLNDPVLRNRS